MNTNTNQLSATGFVRIWQILGDPKAIPPIPPLIPISKSTWWSGIKSGRYPKGVKLSANSTAWRAEDIRKLIESFEGKANEKI
jgi:prophage regulatory protein